MYKIIVRIKWINICTALYRINSIIDTLPVGGIKFLFSSIFLNYIIGKGNLLAYKASNDPKLV